MIFWKSNTIIKMTKMTQVSTRFNQSNWFINSSWLSWVSSLSWVSWMGQVSSLEGLSSASRMMFGFFFNTLLIPEQWYTPPARMNCSWNTLLGTENEHFTGIGIIRSLNCNVMGVFVVWWWLLASSNNFARSIDSELKPRQNRPKWRCVDDVKFVKESYC